MKLMEAKKLAAVRCAASVYAQRNQPKRLEIIRRGLFGEPLCPQR